MIRPAVVTRVAALLVALVLPAVPSLAAEATYEVGAICDLATLPACGPAQDFEVSTDGVLLAEVEVSEGNCATIDVHFSVDGGDEVTVAGVGSGGSTGAVDLGPVAPGTHTLTIGADVFGGLDCDLLSWTGTLLVATSGVAVSDVGYALQGGDVVEVSAGVTGDSPRPAGIAATLTRGATAVGVARISVATYDGLPSGLPPNPVRAAAFLDLQLTNPDSGDTIAGVFLPPNPVFPTDPTLPPNPVFPNDPILPPNPVRLAWWTGSDWSPVLTFDDQPIQPAYDSVLDQFSFSTTFSLLSSPSVVQLGGTVFAIVPNYYFRGFGSPVDSSALNVAKAGRAIPLKWQVFDENAEPVLDLDPGVVKLTSVNIACESAGGATDALEEYAPGASGLEHLGDGVYQLNWKSPKDYAGTCRRLRLDLGERNPDGTTIYRTADFRFTR